jgi:hypothetical protein
MISALKNMQHSSQLDLTEALLKKVNIQPIKVRDMVPTENVLQR